MKKEVVILSKSVKYGKYCVAGREIIRGESGLSLGNWIRPVSNSEDEALSYNAIKYTDHKIPEILDIVEIVLSAPNGTNTQPENFLIQNVPWSKNGHISNKSLPKFIENIDGIWLDPDASTDRISSGSYISQGYNSSLCIIKPDNFQMKIFTNFDDFAGREKKRRRAIFEYNGLNYDLAITDPDIDRKYFQPFPKSDEDAKIIIPATECLLCVSLAPEFHGYHYKLVATIIET